jgi:hypothetical protein
MVAELWIVHAAVCESEYTTITRFLPVIEFGACSGVPNPALRLRLSTGHGVALASSAIVRKHQVRASTAST